VSSIIAAVIAGALFALGLVISGMTDPGKVTAFLDIGGAWDPSLAFVMGGAIAIYAPVAWVARRRARPVFGGRFDLPAQQGLDARLVGGAIVFGVGWGLSGYCPGPALTSIGTGAHGVVVFVLTMLVGIAIARLIRR
jgi:uncharacterized protein